MLKIYKLSLVLWWIFVTYCYPAIVSAQEKETLLSLDNVIDYVAKHNPFIEESYLEWLSKDRQAQAAWGDFEPSLSLSFNRNKLNRENTVLESLQQDIMPSFWESNKEYGTGVGGKFFSGAQYNVGYNIKHLKNSLSTDVQFDSFLGITGEQPLLKGLWFAAPLANLKMAKKDSTIAFNQYRKQLMETLLEAENAYWKLALAQERFYLAKESFEITEKIYEDAKVRLDLGKISQTELTEAKAELKIRQGKSDEAYQELVDASINLKLLLSDSDIKEDQILIASDSLSAGLKEKVDKNYSASQPELVVRQEELEKEKIRLAYYKSQRLPELNLKSSYGWSGLADDERNSWKKVESRNFPEWSVSVEMKIPFFAGVRERNELAAAKLNKQIAEQRLKSVEYELSRVTGSVKQKIKSLEKQIEAAKTAAESKSIILEIGKARFNEGKTDILSVYKAEGEFFEVKNKELETIMRYKESLMQLKYLQGTILAGTKFEKYSR